MEKQRVAVIGPGSWGTALSQVLNDPAIFAGFFLPFVRIFV